MVRGEVTSQSRVSFWVDEMYTSDNEKLKFKTLILDFLNKTEDADSWQECHDWLKAMMLLHKIDESEFSKHAHEIPDKITKAINAIGESDEEEPKKRHPLDVLDEKARKIYWIRSMNLNPEMEKLADTKLRELEKEIMEKHRKDIPSFIEDRFQKVQQLEKEFQEDIKLKVRLEEHMRTVFSHLERSGTQFKREGDQFIFEHKPKNGEVTRWSVDPFGAFRAGDHYCLRCLENDAMMVTVKEKEFLEKVENRQVDELIERAKTRYATEQSDEAKDTIQSFDLLETMPPTAEIVYVRVFPKTYNKAIANKVLPSMLFGETLRHRYGNEKVNMPPTIFSDAPRDAIAAVLDRYQNADVPYRFYIEINTHGETHYDRKKWNGEKNIPYRKPGYFNFVEQELTAKDLAKMTEEFSTKGHPESQFTFATTACHGADMRGGMLEEFKKKPELAERISIFLATKPDTPSSNMKLKFNSSIMNSTTGRYYLLLIKHLYKGKHFGEAARQADIEAKKIDEWDAEAVINGNLITINKPISLDNIIGTV